MPLVHPADVQEVDDLVTTAIPDPLNLHSDTDWTTRSILRLPKAPDERWAELITETPRGSLLDCPQRFDGLSATQRVRIYLPNQTMGSGEIERLMVMFDVDTAINDLRLPVIADNLIAASRIPPTAIAFVDPSDTRTIDLNCSASAANAISREVVPWVRATYGLSNRPEDTAICGGSLGGLMARFWQRLLQTATCATY
jgi:enterochelin esterase-like enzyme